MAVFVGRQALGTSAVAGTLAPVSAAPVASPQCPWLPLPHPRRLQGTILPGVTRRSVLELARDLGYTVEETPISVQEAMEADEIFTTGTAVVLSAVGSLTHEGQRRQFGQAGQPTPVALELYDRLTGLQTERYEDKFGWVHPLSP